MRVFEDTLVLNYSNIRSPPRIFCIRFKEILENSQSVEQLLDVGNLDVNVLEEVNLTSSNDEFGQFYDNTVKNIRSDMVTLDNGVEAMFMRRGDLDPSKRHPMLLLIHGGPFAASPL